MCLPNKRLRWRVCLFCVTLCTIACVHLFRGSELDTKTVPDHGTYLQNDADGKKFSTLRYTGEEPLEIAMVMPNLTLFSPPSMVQSDAVGPREKLDIDIMRALNDSDSYENLVAQMEEISQVSGIGAGDDGVDDPSFYWSDRLSSGINVIVNGGYRTGSSMMGEFLNRHASFVYYFEPLHDLEGANQTIRAPSILLNYVLRKLVQCNLRVGLMGGEKPGSNWWNAVMCGLGGESCNNLGFFEFNGGRQERYESLCKSKPNQAVKVIRVHSLQYLEPLMRRGVKIVQLIRDPRGTFQSRSQLAPVGDRMDNIREYCTSHVDDLDYLRRLYKTYGEDVRESVFYVRYEDMAQRPISYLYQLYNFLGTEPDENVLRWAEDIQKQNVIGSLSKNQLDSKRQGSTSTHRANPAFTAHAWRTTMSNTMCSRVQAICARFMTEFHYLPFNDTASTRNYNRTSLYPLGDVISR